MNTFEISKGDIGMTSQKLDTRLLSSMDKVFPSSQLNANAWEYGETFQGECIRFQLAYFWKGEPSWAEWELISPLHNVSVSTVELEPAEYVWPVYGDNQFCTKDAGLFPDIIKPCGTGHTTLRLYSNQWKSLWIRVDTSEEAAGSFPITIRIREKENILSEDTFKLKILPSKLPEQKLLFTQWLHTDCIAQQYHIEVFSEEWWVMTEKYVRFAAQHGINMLLTPLFTPPLDTLPGGERLTVQLVDVIKTDYGWQFGFERLERWIQMAHRCGIFVLEASHLFTQWGAEHAPKIIARTNQGLQQVFGWNTDAAGPEYTGFLEVFLPQLTTFFRAKGLEGQVYFHISDEPAAEHLKQYEKLSHLIHRLTEGFPKIDALSDYSFYEKGLIDIPVCATNHIGAFLEHQTPHLWAYYCCCQADGVSNRFLGMPGARNRCIGLQLYHHNIEGFLHWGYNFWMTQYSTKVINPYQVSDAGGAFPAGDAFSVYPGEDGPIASVGLELFHEALQDLSVFQLAESLCGREAVQSLYENISWKDFHHTPQSAEEILLLRHKVNQLIIQKSDSLNREYIQKSARLCLMDETVFM